MKLILTALAAITLLAGCEPALIQSEAHYARPEVTQRAQIERCRVLEVRHVTVGAEMARTSSYGRGGYYRQANIGQPEEQFGALLGGALGAAVGSQIGGGSGKAISTALVAGIGSAAGKAQGSKMAARRMARPGIEYSVLLGSQEEQVIVQYHNPADRIAAPGSTCRIASSPQGLRVMPADHLPGQVARPAQTTFSN
jgi:outer membrane lipoprotein SlyB